MSKKIAVLITGRGNNTLRNKNILPVNGLPLMSYGAIEAKKLNNISKFYISSDDDNILQIGEELGFKRIKRPDYLGAPTSPHGDAVKHALEVMKIRDGFVCDILIIVMANCATIECHQIQDCLALLSEDESISTVAPVIKNNDHHPFRAKRIDLDGFVQTFIPLSGNKIASNRQQLEPNYFLCHSFYVLRVNKCFSENGQPPWNFMGNKIKPYVVKYSLDVHSQEDIWLTEKWLNKKKDEKC
tara:strand:+ start:245 stop:970 length:726 start_codon:yes stop_codon:yes gene_type:complete